MAGTRSSDDGGRDRALSRRRFFARGIAAGAAAGIALALRVPGAGGGIAGAAVTAPGGGGRSRGFLFEHDEAIDVLIGPADDPTRLDIRVRRLGREVERHAAVDPARIHRLRSAYVRVRTIAPPA